MAAPDTAGLARLARLLREYDVDLAALGARAAESAEVLPRLSLPGPSRADVVLLAANLHGYYTALETLLGRVAGLFDQEVPRGASRHMELLEQMLTDVPGLRPALLPASVMPDLHELRKFRHFFRNAYVLDLDVDKIRGHAERLSRLDPPLRASLEGFRRHAAAILDELSRPR
jgi:hypothetical protein